MLEWLIILPSFETTVMVAAMGNRIRVTVAAGRI